MSIIGNIKGFVDRTKTAVSNFFTPTRSGNSMTFNVGEGLSPIQAQRANQIVGIKNTTKGGLTYPTGSGGVISGTNFNVPSLNLNKANKSGGLTYSGGGGGTTAINLPVATAPTDVSKISSNIGTMNLSAPGTSGTTTGVGGTMGVGSIANATSALTGIKTRNEQDIQSELEKARLTEVARKTEERNWLKDMFQQRNQEPTPAQQRADLNRQYDIQAKTAEINSLTQSLGKVEAEVQSQVAQTYDKLGSMNFINNQIAQINRNAAPALNRLRADINFKTGILTQTESLIEQAIQDATADSRQRWENLKWFRQENQDIESKLSPEYQRALNIYDKQLERNYNENIKEVEWKRDMILKYGLPNSVTDSTDSIARAAARTQQPKQNNIGYKFTNTQLNSGSAKAGVDINSFKSLNPDVQNYYVSAPKTALNAMKEAVKNNDIELIDSSSLAPSVKEYFKSQIVPKEQKVGLWESIKNLFN